MTAAEGFVLGVIGSFLVPVGPHVGVTLVFSVGVLLALVGLPVLVRLSSRAGGDRLVGLAPITGFLAAATLAQSPRSGGVVLPSSLAIIDAWASWAFLLGGALAGGLAVSLRRHRR